MLRSLCSFAQHHDSIVRFPDTFVRFPDTILVVVFLMTTLADSILSVAGSITASRDSIAVGLEHLGVEAGPELVCLSVGEDVGAAWLSSVGVFVVGCHDDGDGVSVGLILSG